MTPPPILERVPLAPRTTLELGGPARFFVEAHDVSTLSRALAWARSRDLSVRILGGGSNLVVSDEGVAGLVIAVRMRGVTYTEHGDRVIVEAQAGEPWDELVAETVARGLAGLECLSGIPGLVGATPIQNVGAYGQEVSDTIVAVRVCDPSGGRQWWIEAADCAFSYRDSAFKSGDLRDLVIVAVRFALRPGGAPAIRHAELERALGHGSRTLATVRQTVLALRRAKSMVIAADDPNRRSAGSFFTNPIVPAAFAERLAATHPTMPRWPQPDGRVKLAAGWLIEQSGICKGLRRGPVGVSSRHALALVHHGGGTTRQLLALADEVAAAVRARFGIVLEREPVLW